MGPARRAHAWCAARGERIPLFGRVVALERDFYDVGELCAVAEGHSSACARASPTMLSRSGGRFHDLALSNARTQWGVCTEDGAIRLSWRLVHLQPALADYGRARMRASGRANHSRRFYRLLAALTRRAWCARAPELAGAALPIFKETT